MGEFFDAFSVDVPKLAFQVINFLLLLYLANRFLFKRVLSLLDERNARISKGLEDAETAARDRELARAEREAAVAEARKEANEMLARANKIAEDTRNEILGEARSEAEKVTQRAREEITAEKDKAMSELRAQVADLALEAAAKLGRSDGTLDAWERDLQRLNAALDDEQLRALAEHPAVPYAEKERVIRRAVGDVSAEAFSLVLLMIRRGRPRAIPRMVEHFATLLRRERGLSLAEVRTALELDNQQRTAVLDRLHELTGDEIEINEVVDESLIGGITV